MTGPASLAVGSVLAERAYGPVTRSDFVRYAGASGDFHPMHHDDEYARSIGLPSVFAMGMFQASVLAGYAAEHLGSTGWVRYAVRFRDRVWPGDVLTCGGRVTAGRHSPDGRLILTVDLECRTATAVVVSAVAELAPEAR